MVSNGKLINAIYLKNERSQCKLLENKVLYCPTERALGVIWDVQNDELLLKIKPNELADTRRKVISLAASIYDPIGFLAPFISHCPSKDVSSVFVVSRQGWDEKIPEEIEQEWSAWQKKLESLAELSVPRFYRPLWLPPPPFNYTCLVMQVRRRSPLLHPFDLSILVERDSVH